MNEQDKPAKEAVLDPGQVSVIFRQLNRVKQKTARGEISAALIVFVEVLRKFMSTPMLQKDRKELTQEIDDLLYQLGSNPKFTQQFGPVSFASGDYGPVVDYFVNLVQVETEGPETILGECEAMVKQGQVSEAVARALQVIKDNPIETDIHLDVADRLMKWERYAEAERVLHMLLGGNPESVPLINRLAMALRNQQKFTEAVTRYKQAIDLEPRDEGLYFNLAVVLAETRELEAAHKVLNMALAVKPGFERALKLIETIEAANPELARK